MHWLAFSGFFLARRAVFWRGMCVSYFLLIFMQTRFSLPIWEHLPALRFLQFPSRLHTILDVIQFMAITQCGRIKEIVGTNFYRFGCMTVSVATLALIVIYYRPFNLAHAHPAINRIAAFFEVPEGMIVDYQRTKQMLDNERFSSFSATDELRPRTALRKGLHNRFKYGIPVAMVESSADASPNNVELAIQRQGLPWRISLAVSIPMQYKIPPAIIINQFYFPGWIVRINGTPLRLGGSNVALPNGSAAYLRLSPNGLMRINITDPGQYVIEAYYDGPPGWPLRNAIGVALLICMMVTFYVLHRQYLIRT
jgi:hypothetical protein